jgi:glycosyltransferase involved in cell wall biosynthesis
MKREQRGSPDSLAVLTDIPSPYQVELFDALSRELGGRFKAIYMYDSMIGRDWLLPRVNHSHLYLSRTTLSTARVWIAQTGIAVFGAYKGNHVPELLKLRNKLKRPWAFWGERPGFTYPGILGRLARIVGQRHIRTAGVPVWGIGDWAVEGYKHEIGGDRLFMNVPYFSDLKRFLALERGDSLAPAHTRFLFSGLLIERKGVDLLAQAFLELISGGADAELTCLGAGPLEASLREVTSPVANRVHFVGFRQWQELPSVYATHDVLCAPSRYDGWGLIVPEGLAAGMPVIASDRMGAARDLVRAENGWIVRAGDRGSLVAAMTAATRQSERDRATTLQAARHAARRQDIEAGVRCVRNAMTETLAACRILGHAIVDQA